LRVFIHALIAGISEQPYAASGAIRPARQQDITATGDFLPGLLVPKFNGIAAARNDQDGQHY
jgi:hypothetical protein